MTCANLAVPLSIMQHIVNVESSSNPYAIGVVGGHLARQPKNLAEAVSTAKMLEKNGYNFSLGISQVNRYNLAKYSIKSYAAAFDVCTNLRAGSQILNACYQRANGDWQKAFSCYYSGNFVTGYKLGYVQKVMASISRAQKNGDGAIAVYRTNPLRKVAVSNYPAYENTASAKAPVNTAHTDNIKQAKTPNNIRIARVEIAKSQPISPKVESNQAVQAQVVKASLEKPVKALTRSNENIAKTDTAIIRQDTHDPAFVF